MNRTPEWLYLDLLKKALSFTLWPEPPIPIDAFGSEKSGAKKLWYSTLSGIAGSMGLQLVQGRGVSAEDRTEGRIWPGYAHTMIGLRRLDNLQFCIETTLKDGIEGDLIETGVWRGGACILMRAVLAVHGVKDRKVFVADSFEGGPEPDAESYPADKDDRLHVHDFLRVSQPEVEDNFRKYGLLDGQVVFLKGWFKDTLPKAPIQRLSIMRLDGDMYGSTIEALESLYPKLSPGGYCIIDDYALHGCKKAVDDYRRKHGIEGRLEEVDWTGRFWRKS